MFNGKEKDIYCGQMREYYGTIIGGKAERLLKLLMEWDKAGGNDEGIER